MDTLFILGLGLVLFALAMLPFYRRTRRLERHAEAAEEKAVRYGLKEPASLHPVVDASACIGTGNCVAVCPEKDVLGLLSGQARPVSPARCVGHGLCERSCPVEAIQLVFGTATRGVDIPRIRENFETNVPGLFIIGELGGMGLIRNAFEQGRQCIEGIARAKRPAPAGVLDVLIVGCGPAGLSASLCCLHYGLSFRTLEREDVGGTVRYYPRKKLVMTAPLKIPGYGKLNVREILKEDLMALWEDIIARTGLTVQTGETVTDVTPDEDGCFRVTSTAGTYRARHVVLAIGRRGTPRKLGIPGEDLPKVAYSLREPEAFQQDRILVVGGGDSAVEAALALSEQPGNDVKISYRRNAFSRIKPDNLARVERAQEQGRLEVLWSTNVVRVEPDRVFYQNGALYPLPNDYLFIFAGGVLPTRFLERCGVRIDTRFGEPYR